MTRLTQCLAGPLVGLSAVVFSAAAAAIMPPSGTVRPPPYTDSQANAGARMFAAHCASCHGGDLQGAAGPALSGQAFRSKWTSNGKNFGDLYYVVKSRMPLNAPGSLSGEQYVDLMAFLFASNGFSAGVTQLNDEALTQSQSGGGAQAAPKLALKLPAAPKSVKKASTDRPGDAEIAHPAPGDWLMYNKTLSGQRYSTLRQITAKNAGRLTPACAFQLGEVGSFQASPVVYDGMMYVTSGYGTYAIDPSTCRKIWSHTYPGRRDLAVVLSRGVAIYKGKLFRVTPNGHMLALDAKTGALLWDAQLADPAKGYWLSAAPIAYNGMVFVGEAGADFGANGHIYGIDAETGKVRWTFNVIPTGKEPGADTWKKGAQHGGGSSWSTYTLSPRNGLLYVSVGNPSPDYFGAMRPGDNLYTNSVVVLHYRTGKLAWYVQQVPHDVHDWDTAAAPIVYDQGGKSYLAVANKGGWLYIYDRATHRLIARPEVTTHLNADAPITTKGTHYCPGILGGVQWNGPAYSPQQKLLFVNSVDWCGTTRLTEDRYIEGSTYFDGSYSYDPIATAHGWTRAFDAATGKPAWTRRSKTPMVAALTPTAGGVVFTGDLDGNFLVLDAKDGKALYRFNTGGAVAGAASTYLVDGKQYVAITSGNNSRSIWQTTGSATVFVFSLPRK